jgi:glycyl-tRNA synthetase alpha chain
VTFQQLIFKLSEFWASRGCLIQQPHDIEMGAGTMHAETFLRVLGPNPWKVAYVQPSRRPADGRFGENPNRLYKHHQFQVILKPAPDDVQQLYLQSLEAVGIDLDAHDVRFEEDNWESPTLGAWGIGWQVLYDGLEITQFTYFQQAGGLDLSPISAELTYGLERLAMTLQGVDNVYDLQWAPGVKYRDVRHRDEVEQSKYSFGQVDGISRADFVRQHREWFDEYHAMAAKLLEAGLVLPALDYTLKSSHTFNLLDAMGGIGVTERTSCILRVRQLAVAIAKAWVGEREAKGTRDSGLGPQSVDRVPSP